VQVSWREMRAVIAAFAANLGIAIIKFVAFLLTGSASMLAESVHSVADTGNEVLLLVGHGRSSRPPSDAHPFGFGRERYFYGFVVSVMLFTVGAAFSIYDGVHKILTPASIDSPLIAFGVLAVSAVAEAFSLRTGIREANKVRGDRSWTMFIRRTKIPELPVVLLEDTAALIGLVFAFAGIALSVLTSDGRWDGAGSLGIGLLLATAAVILAIEMKSLLIGEAASPEMQRMIIAALEDGPELAQVIHLRTVHMSPDAILVTAKVAIREDASARQITSGIDAAERRVREVVPIAKTIYLEPDIYRPQQPDHTNPSVRAVMDGHARRPPRRDRPKPPAAPGPPDAAPGLSSGAPRKPGPETPGDPSPSALTPYPASGTEHRRSGPPQRLDPPGPETGSSGRAVLHAVAELDQPLPYPAFGRAEGDTQQAGDLEIGMPVVEGEHDGFPLQAAQVTQAPAQLLALQGVCDDIADLVQVRHRSGPPLPVGGSGGPPDPVDGAAAGDRQHPRCRAAPVGVVAGRCLPDLQENLLGDLLSLRRIAEHGADRAVDRRGQLLEDEIERAMVPPAHSLEQHVQVIPAGTPGIRPGSQASAARNVSKFGAHNYPQWSG
jgi:cation diffusion facilitator family transporter